MSGSAHPAPSSDLGRRIAVSIVLGGILFLVLWLAVFSAMTSLLAGAGTSVVIVAAGTSSDLVESILDAIGAVLVGILAVIGAVLGALFNVFQ